MCGKDRRGLTGVRGCDTPEEARRCQHYQKITFGDIGETVPMDAVRLMMEPNQSRDALLERLWDIAESSRHEYWRDLLVSAVEFMVWGAGEGLSPEDAPEPESTLLEWSRRTGDEDWEVLGTRAGDYLRSLSPADRRQSGESTDPSSV